MGGGSVPGPTQIVSGPPQPAALDPQMLEAHRRRRSRRTGLRARTVLGPGAARPSGTLSAPGLIGGSGSGGSGGGTIGNAVAAALRQRRANGVR